MAIYMGNQNVETNGLSTMQNRIFCMPVSLASAGILQSISIYIDTTYTTNMRLCVYADSSGAPGALLAETAAWSVVSTGWNTRSTLTNPSLAAGSYWLAFKYQADSIVMMSSLTGSCKRRNLTYTSGSFPDPAGTFSTTENVTLSWYATLNEETSSIIPIIMGHNRRRQF